MSTHWQTQRERGSPVLVRLIRWIALHLGRPPARLLLFPIVGYFLLALGRARRASRAYLRRITGRPAGLRHVAKHFYYFAATILDRLFFVIGKTAMFDTTTHNQDELMRRVANGQGCILLGSHLGSFEALRAIGVTHEKLPLKVLMYQHHNETVTKVVEALNPNIAGTVIPLGQTNTMLRANECVEQGGVVGMLADRVDDPRKTVTCDFLGGQAKFPTGPMILAAALKAPVILIFALYRGANRYDLHFELFAEQITLPRHNRQAEIQKWTQRYADRLACYTQSAPYNWFNFYDFWDEYS